MVSLFTLKTCLKMIIGRLRPVINLVLGFGFDFGNEKSNNLHSKQPTSFRKMNCLLMKMVCFYALKKVLGTNRIKLGLGGKRWCELLSFAVMTGATR